MPKLCCTLFKYEKKREIGQDNWLQTLWLTQVIWGVEKGDALRWNPPTEIYLSNTEAEYIALYQGTRNVLIFWVLWGRFDSYLNLNGTLQRIGSVFLKTRHISQRQSRGNHTRSCSKNLTSYQAHHNQISSLPYFFTNGDVEIKHVDTRKKIVDIFTRPLDPELLEYLRYKVNWW